MDNPLKPNRWWDLPAAFLLLATIITAAMRLAATEWADDLSLIPILVSFGVIIGLVIGQSRFSTLSAAFLGLAYGLFLIPWQLGLRVEGVPSWRLRLITLAERLDTVSVQLADREPVRDSILFILLMCILFWILSTHAGYTLTRTGNAWAAVLPSGLVMFAVHSFDVSISTRSLYQPFYIFLCLILVARIAYVHHQNNWKHKNISLPSKLDINFIRFALILAGIFLLFSFTFPALAGSVSSITHAASPIRSTWDEMKGSVKNVFISLRTNVLAGIEYYGPITQLGLGNPLSDDEIFLARTSFFEPQGERYYWRARVYDTYEDGQWLNSLFSSGDYNPREINPLFSDERGRWVSSFELYSLTRLSTLFTPSQPLWVSRKADVEFIKYPDGTFDYSIFRANQDIKAGEWYEVHASLSNASAEELRESGDEYPAWISDDYLQLPGSITTRTLDLAQKITKGLDNPYDKVVAINNYLRETITYQDTVSGIPKDQEAIDWFLFDYQSGFCNYYATAEVILLRAVGIPARWAIGFAQGEEQDDGSYIVLQSDAHAWPEVYFSGFGWVEFEPTGSLPNIIRAIAPPTELDEPNLLLDSGSNDEYSPQELEQYLLNRRADQIREQELANERGFRILLVAWLTILGTIFSILFLFWRYRTQLELEKLPVKIEKTFIRYGLQPPTSIEQWSRSASLPPITKSYSQINTALARLGHPPDISSTPSERANKLNALEPCVEKMTTKLVHEYQVATYSPDIANAQLAITAGSEIRKLTYRVILRRWLSKFTKRFLQ
jgi:transglutaminase-like putative cysteine protease